MANVSGAYGFEYGYFGQGASRYRQHLKTGVIERADLAGGWTPTSELPGYQFFIEGGILYRLNEALNALERFSGGQWEPEQPSSLEGISRVEMLRLINGNRQIGPGYLGVFGRGLVSSFKTPGVYTFTVHPGVTQMRFRVVGAGGGGCGGTNTSQRKGAGGGGGGYAHGVFDVTPGLELTLTVGERGLGGRDGTTYPNPTSGGTTSVGAFISATGGEAGTDTVNAVDALGGTGVGGDFQADGGKGSVLGGGGGAGSQLGDGGDGNTGGGGVLHSAAGRGGAGPFGTGGDANGAPDILGRTGWTTALERDNPLNQTVLFPFEMFLGGGGSQSGGIVSSRGGPGGGGAATLNSANGIGGDGGGGGATYLNSSASTAASGGIGGGGGGNELVDDNAPGGPGGDGLIILEW